MQIFNYHTHTFRCKHARGTDEEYVLAAIEAGYKILGFSDHAPYRDYPSERSHMDIEELDEYISSISELKEKYKDRIKIHIGLETEYYPFNHDERVRLHDRVEYLILGQHYADPQGRTVNYFTKNSEEEILDYGKSVVQALDSGLFLYLAHPDVIMNRQDEFTPACRKVAHMIGRKASELNIPVEINARGAAKGKKPFPEGLRYWYPHKEFWSIMSQYPIRCLAGVDAHDPKDLLKVEDVANAFAELKDLDLNYIREPLL